MICVIGSGLTGIATAAALVKRGFKPTILDTGIEAGSAVKAIKARLASAEPADWSPSDLKQLRQMGASTASGIPRKLHFGSDFPYKEADTGTAAQSQGASILRSFARGGFSNVWGGVIPDAPQNDPQDWPFDSRNLSEHYEAIRHLLAPSSKSVERSAQARALHDDLSEHRNELAREGIRFSPATLAVRSTDDGESKGCRLCGLCLYGCPYDSIFSAAAELDRMVRSGEVEYLPNVIVDRITPQESNVRIEGRCAQSGRPRTFNFRKVFLAAGVMESARIVLNCTGNTTTSLRIRQSDIFTIPMLRYRASPGANERLHTLCHTVLEVNDDRIAPLAIQLQLYGYNDQYQEILKQRLGRLARTCQSALHHVTDRLLVAFGYLHSDISSSVRIRRLDSPFGRLHIEGEVSESSRGIGRAVAGKLFRNRHSLQAVSLPGQTRFDIPGAGHRSGGCFPMRRNPQALETDSLGRLPGLPSVHVVDSSVLPSIVAGPLAFTVMANAHRIASECSLNHA